MGTKKNDRLTSNFFERNPVLWKQRGFVMKYQQQFLAVLDYHISNSDNET